MTAWLVLATLLMGPGLERGPGGTVLRAGQPYHGIGVNYFDAVTRALGATEDTSYRAGLAVLADRGIPFCRLSLGGFYPNDYDPRNAKR